MFNLHINTYAEAELPDRYMSSEEEPSPSPESETYDGGEQELEHKSSSTVAFDENIDSTCESSLTEEYKAEIAVAVPIFVGRPKLVDIINIAPMHKRKRSAENPMFLRHPVKRTESTNSGLTDRTTAFVAPGASQVAAPEMSVPKRKVNNRMLPPESWLPDEATIVQEEDEDHYLPGLELRSPLTYSDYDPYGIYPPRLSLRNSCSSKGGQKHSSIAPARININLSASTYDGWKAMTWSLSSANKQRLHRECRQVAKKAKMVARGADGIQATPVIADFGENIQSTER